MKLTGLVGIVLFGSVSVYAQDIELIGSFQQPIQASSSSLQTSDSALDEVTLLKYKLSGKASAQLLKRAKRFLSTDGHKMIQSETYPARVQLGMGDVPVLDQGQHGSCVTFAITAAIDAVLGKGDYISQLCQLQLGRHLQYNAYGYSGWNGSYSSYVLSQMKLFGIVSKEKQREFGCGGLYEYPLTGADPETEMSLADYHQISEKLSRKKVQWSPILDMATTEQDRVDTTEALNLVKKALHAGDRVTFATFLTNLELGKVGAIGKHHVTNDTWVLTTEMVRDLYLRDDEIAGHQMIITGYDDDAIATDDQGRKYRGLLTLRNSWGVKAGNQGDFYMSYDFFKTFVADAERIRHIKPD